MSGLEVAGLVLGSIPIVVSALEHYGHGLSTLQRWRKYERELRSLIRNLKTEQVKLQNVCEKLLVGLAPSSKIESMINNPLGDLWREDETQRKIRVRLWKGYEAFEATIGDVKAAIDEMSERIESQRGGKVSSEIKRAVFTFSRSQYADILTTIREGISNLENLTDRNMELEPARRVRSQGRFFLLLREMSKSLYGAIRYSLDCACGHDVGLRLESRSADFIPAQSDDEVMDKVTFKMALSYNASKDAVTFNEKGRLWQELLVKPKQAAKSSKKGFATNVSTPQAQPKKDKGKKTVGFADSWSFTSSGTTLVQTETYVNGVGLHMSKIGLSAEAADLCPLGLKKCLNLCESIKGSQKQKSVEPCGMITDQSSNEEEGYDVYSIPTSSYEDTQTWSVISLKEVLESNNDSLYLSYRDRLQIAVVLSSSILQLYDSPWLPDIISSHDIFFIMKHDYPFYNHPLVMQNFLQRKPSEKREESGHLPFNSMLLSLGVLLVELILGSTLESHRSGQQGDSSISRLLLDYMAAQRLLDQGRMLSSNYEAAVTRCFGELNKSSYGLEAEDFCQDMYSGVVALLEKDLEYISAR